MKLADYDYMSGKKLARNLSNLADQKICSLYQGHTSSRDIPWAIIAIGGYGRQELCPHSDLDILVLLDKKIPGQFTKEILASTIYPLWDDHLSVSYSVRTIKNVLKDISHDFFLKTSLLDVRFVCGSKAPYTKLFKAIQKRQKEKKEFLQTLLAHTSRREHDFGDAGYVLEPNLKEGRGGLRDMQEIAWLNKIIFELNDISELAQAGFLSAIDLSDLDAAHDYILKARFILHCLVQHKTDSLFIEHQESLSRQLYPGEASRDTTREMMQELHSKARIVKSLHDIIVSYAFEKLDNKSSHKTSRMIGEFVITKNQIGFAHLKTLRDNPDTLMQAFSLMAEKNLSLKPMSLQLVREHAESGNVRTNETSIRCFLKILRSDQPGPALIQMLELGVLEKIIPEFTLIKGLTMGNSFHRFTVDLHSIQTLLELKKLELSQPEIFEMVKDTTPLYLSALLHDIGKISTTNHEEHGAEMAKNIALRLGLSEQDSVHVNFLVRNHLQFSITAHRRDLSEESVVFLFAQRMGDPQRLAMLHLLSVADALATSEAAWTPWKQALVLELFYKSLNILEKGILKDPQNAINLDQKWKILTDRLPGQSLWSLPQAYILASDVDEIIKHIELSATISDQVEMVVDVTPKNDHFSLGIITRDRPGLFSILTGILAIRHLEIHTARIFTWLNGLAVDVFEISAPWHDYTEWDKIVDDFRKITSRELDLADTISHARPLVSNQNRKIQAQRIRITIDNTSSDFFTLIEVHAYPRLGLLHHISHAFAELDLNIHRAFISSTQYRSANTFYVVDNLGEKIEDESLKERIRSAVVLALNE